MTERVLAYQQQIPVTHVITGRAVGGAENSLVQLLSHMDRDRFPSEVLILADDLVASGDVRSLDQEVRALGVPVHCHALAANPRGVVRVGGLAAALRRRRGSIIQTWLYHADLIGGLAARATGNRRVVWSLRSSSLEGVRPRTVFAARACARLSSAVPAAIVAGSSAAEAAHRELGYDGERMVVIPNGVAAPKVFPEQRRARAQLGLPQSGLLLGRVGRFDPAKDHEAFVRAASQVMRSRADLDAVLCGRGCTSENAELMRWIATTGLAHRFHLLGPKEDMSSVYASLDVSCSSSVREGFPNVVAEALAHRIPTVATDVGDSAIVVGRRDWLVPARDPQALAAALLSLLALPKAERRRQGDQAAATVMARYSWHATAQAHGDLYQRVWERPARGGTAAAAS